MILSQRLWWSVAHNTGLEPADVALWAKVFLQCEGKRHYLREIDLTPDEEAAAVRILRHPPDEVMRRQIQHEAENYPDGWERSLRWLPEGTA